MGTRIIRRGWLLVVSALATALALVAPTAGAASPTVVRAADGNAMLVAIRAAHHPGYDRIVFQFNRSSAPKSSVEWVPALIGDFSGQVVPVPGRAVLKVVFTGAQAHTDAGVPTVDTTRAFPLPNIMSLRNGGDFEGVITLGVGLAKKTTFRVHRLTNPGRVAIDVSTPFERTDRRVYFQDALNFRTGTEPLVKYVLRPVPTAYPATGLMDRLYAGPTNAEEARGLRLVNSRSTWYSHLTVADQIARLRLRGGCSSGGSTFTIADEIMPTLRRLPTVSWIKIYDWKGTTERPTGQTDSIPSCLEP